MNIKIYIATVTALLLIGCSIKKPSDFTLFYAQNKTGLDTLINIDGYYTTNRACDTAFHSAFIFYPDGLFSIVTGTDLNDAIECFFNDKNTTLCENLSWGYYEIKNDTVTTQTLKQEGLEYYVIHRDYVITENKSLINLTEYVNTENLRIGYLRNYPSFFENQCNKEAIFHPIDKKRRNKKFSPLLSIVWLNVPTK